IHKTNHVTRWIVEAFFPIARANNHAATAGIAARKRFHARKPSASEPDRANRNSSKAPHQPSSITKSRSRGACSPLKTRGFIHVEYRVVDGGRRGGARERRRCAGSLVYLG